jgi:hypothetical protein
MNNPLVISILGYLRKQDSSCSLIDLVNLCEEGLLSLIQNDTDPQIIIFQKNFFVMNALYQIQRDIQTEGFLLTILPLEISLLPHYVVSKSALTTRDTDLANYYLNWSNLDTVTVEEVEELFSHFWQGYHAVDKIDAALITLGLKQDVQWFEIHQAYQKKIFTSHPDKGGNVNDFIEIRQAYEVLKFSHQGA